MCYYLLVLIIIINSIKHFILYILKITRNSNIKTIKTKSNIKLFNLNSIITLFNIFYWNFNSNLPTQSLLKQSNNNFIYHSKKYKLYNFSFNQVACILDFWIFFWGLRLLKMLYMIDYGLIGWTMDNTMVLLSSILII